MSADIDTSRAPSTRYRAGAGDTRCAILRASERWFRRVGFRRTAVSDIATDLGMSPANIYRFFGSKAAIGEAVAEQVLGEIVEKLRRVAEADNRAPAEKLRGVLLCWAEATATLLGSDDHIGEMVEAAMREPWGVCIEHARQIDRILHRIIEAGIATGDFAVRNIEDCTRCTRAAMLGFTHPSFCREISTAPTADQMAAFVLDALSADRR